METESDEEGEENKDCDDGCFGREIRRLEIHRIGTSSVNNRWLNVIR